MTDCIFCKIADKEIPANIVLENDRIVAFKDVNPQAPVHIVIIPKEHIDTLNDVSNFSLYGDIFQVIQKLARDLNIDQSGYRVIANCNRNAMQSVFHIHFHLMGGRVFGWPPG